MAGVDHAPTTIAVASAESHGISPLVAVPASISTVARQSLTNPEPETPTPNIQVPMSPFSPDIILQDNLESTESTVWTTESEQNPLTQHPGSSFIANAQNILIPGGTFINCQNYNVNILPANTGEGQMKNPVHQQPVAADSIPFFTGRKDVLDKLECLKEMRRMREWVLSTR